MPRSDSPTLPSAPPTSIHAEGGSRSATREGYWADYYEGICKDGPQWLDYSNERVHLQTFGAVIEASDHLLGKKVLDVGCGRGLFCRTAKVLGAASVTGIDQVASAMAALAKEFSDIRFLVGDIGDSTFREQLGRFDNIYLLEVLQYLPVPKVFDWVWEVLEPGGLVSAVFPYEGCPLVQKTVARFDGLYCAPSLQKAADWAAARQDLATWAVRGFRFQADQRIVPYELGGWTQHLAFDQPPNRIQLVLRKTPAAG